MAVLVEGISAIVRVEAIYEHYDGDWTSFVKEIPNGTLCSDDELARVGFMSPDDCRAFVWDLERVGMVFVLNDQSQDIVVAEQLTGFTVPCDWAEFGHIEISPGQRVAAARMKGSSIGKVFCPEGWRFEGSLSQGFGVVPSGKEEESLRFLRHDDGMDVYLNLLTGEEVYIGRTGQD
jgi:hypothetical protein